MLQPCVHKLVHLQHTCVLVYVCIHCGGEVYHRHVVRSNKLKACSWTPAPRFGSAFIGTLCNKLVRYLGQVEQGFNDAAWRTISSGSCTAKPHAAITCLYFASNSTSPWPISCNVLKQAVFQEKHNLLRYTSQQYAPSLISCCLLCQNISSGGCKVLLSAFCCKVVLLAFGCYSWGLSLFMRHVVIHEACRYSWGMSLFMRHVVIHEACRYSWGMSLFMRHVVIHEACRYSWGMSLFMRPVVIHEACRYSWGMSLFMRPVVIHEACRYSWGMSSITSLAYLLSPIQMTLRGLYTDAKKYSRTLPW